jgi:dipeptidyl aminopeptidase/acylaminoacyl peptidase
MNAIHLVPGVLLAGLVVGFSQISINAQEAIPLIPRHVLFGNPDRTAVTVSPDGQQLAFLAARDGVLNVWVAPLVDPAAARPVTQDTTRGIRFYFWAYTSQHIVYVQDKGGDENWRCYSVDLRTGQERDLTPFEGVQARIQQVSQKFPDELLVTLNNRTPQLHDLYRLHLLTGQLEKVLENPGELAGGSVNGFITDDDFQVRFASVTLPDGGGKILSRTRDETWQEFVHIPPEDMMTTGLWGFDKTGQVVYLADSRERNTAGFFAQELTTGQKRLLAEDPRADVNGWLRHPAEKTAQAVSFEYDRRHWKVLDEAIREDVERLSQLEEGDLNIVSRSLDDRIWIAAFNRDQGPTAYYRYERPARRATFLFTDRKALEGVPLARMHPVIIPSRDGWDLVSYLSLPVESDPEGQGRPRQPLAMVLLVHGGPWGRDSWGYNGLHQWLANRGYAVLSVNFRASTGLGKAFTNAGDKEWGAAMHADLIDAVNWAIAQGIAHPRRIAIMGISYGGYATLVGLTFTPEVFACGVDIVGPVNLITLLESIPPYWKPILDLFAARIGDPRTEEGRALLRERSPLTHVERIARPLLIGQGANDPRVKQAESDQIVTAMQAKGLPVTYVLFPDEGHGFARPENRLAFFAVAEAFLSQQLGGRYEPIGEALTGSSFQVPQGAALVPGLSEALTR